MTSVSRACCGFSRKRLTAIRYARSLSIAYRPKWNAAWLKAKRPWMERTTIEISALWGGFLNCLSTVIKESTMITDINILRRALKGSKPLFAGIVLWEGASLLDGAPVVAIANKIMGKSANGKTGAMVQTFIIRSDMDPVAALRN